MPAIQPVRSARVNLRLYRTMVRAVRAWVQVAHPSADRLTLVREDWRGAIDQLAAFHADAGDDWSRGDALARRHN